MRSLSRAWAAVLVTSLAMNLFVLGFIAANGVRAAQMPAALVAKAEKAEKAEKATAVKPPAQAAAPQLQRIVQINTKALRPTQLAVRKANDSVTAALLAEPYDAPQLARALEELRSATVNSQQAVHAAMLEAVTGMSAQQRTDFAEASKRTPAERVLLVGR